MHHIYQSGLTIADTSSTGIDLWVKQADDITTEDLNSGKKFIVFEKADGAEIAHKHVLKHPAVIRYVKRYNYNNYRLHNEPGVDDRLFTRGLVSANAYTLPQPTINEEDYRKIFLGFNFLHTPGKLPFVETEPDILSDNNRELDVFFAGNIHYQDSRYVKSGELISAHRKKCIDIMESLHHLEVVAIPERSLESDVYQTAVYNSKIIVSPWGWGEACHRDYEAILAGCMLIKPQCDFVQSACNIFNTDYCIWTQPDFSDLQLQIETALDNWDASRKQRYRNRQQLIERFNEMPALIRSVFDL